MRKIIIGLVMLMVVLGAFGTGISEDRSLNIDYNERIIVTTKDDKGNDIITTTWKKNMFTDFRIATEPSFGKVKVILQPKLNTTGLKIFAAKIGGKKFGSPYFYDNDRLLDDAKFNSFFDSRPNIIPNTSIDYFVTSFSPVYGLQSVTEIFRGRMKKMGIPDTDIKNIREAVVGEFYIENFGEEMESEIKMIFNINNELITEYIKFTFIPEFFKGESKLFNEDFEVDTSPLKGKGYAVKSSALMLKLYPFLMENKNNSYLFLDDKIFKPLKTFSANNPSTIAEFSSIIQNLTIPDEKRVRSYFRNAFSGHFTISYENNTYKASRVSEAYSLTLPYIDMKVENPFNRIYGTMQERHPYIAIYMYYLFKKSKPPLSYLIENKLIDTTIFYNNEQYEPLAVNMNVLLDEGEMLARSALRYLTWGVEYTPYPGFDVNEVGYSLNPVFKSNLDYTLPHWVGAEKGTLNPHLNYLKAGQYPLNKIVFKSNITPIQKIQKFEGDFTSSNLKLTNLLKDNNNQLKISKIDVWTSKNISWDTKRITSTTVEYNGQPITGVEVSRLNDQNIVLDTEVVKQNIHVLRSKARDTISIGYEFKKKETISSLLFVKGLHGTPLANTTKPNELIEIQVKRANGEYEKTKRQVIEFVSYPQAKAGRKAAYFFYTRKNWKEFKKYMKEGEGFYSTKPPRDPGRTEKDDVVINDNVVYCYYIFETPEECYGIKFIDKTNNSFLNAAELMVFPENPIDFEKKDKGQNINIGSVTVNGNGQWKKNNIYYTNIDEDFLLFNGDPERYLTFVPNKSYNSTIKLSFAREEKVQSIVVWETKNDGVEKSTVLSDLFDKEFVISTIPGAIDESLYFSEQIQLNNLAKLMEKLTSPFRSDKIGNPIPYAGMGIDSPRTFNYKMLKQVDAYNTIYNTQKNTSLAINSEGFSSYNEEYVDEIDVATKILNKNLDVINGWVYDPHQYNVSVLKSMDKIKNINPFLPGIIVETKTKHINNIYSPYSADKIAGVDSVGILCGSLAMTSKTGDTTTNYINVVNIINQNVASQLDRYYRMDDSDPAIGHNLWGNPLYYSNETNNILLPETNYRFTRADLEKSTILVPDISEIRVGDLLVNNNTAGNPHIGIVVQLLGDELPAYGSAAATFWNKVMVVSIRKGFRMAQLGLWGNNNVFGGFTASPENYTIRRLLKLTEKQYRYPDIDRIELVKDNLRELECSLEFTNQTHLNRWIPNTAELSFGFKIKLTGVTEQSTRDINLGKYKINLLSPRDPYYGLEDPAADANIFKNRGGDLEFHILTDDPTITDSRLATFSRQNGVDLTEDTHYNISYNSEYYWDDETMKDAYTFETVNDNLMLVKYKPDAGGNRAVEKTFDTFALKALAPYRPGDDFQIRFGLEEEPTVPCISKAGDFLAVYDKKMMWRAQLYIDETLNEDGTPSTLPDWNNLYPWTDEENNWNTGPEKEIPASSFETEIINKLAGDDRNYMENTAYKKDTGKNVYILQSGQDEERITELMYEVDYRYKPGGQMRINPWTRPYDPTTKTVIVDGESKLIKTFFTNPNTSVYDAVAYTHAGSDSPEDFNSELEDQLNALRKYSNGTWTSTLAPGDEWENYINYRIKYDDLETATNIKVSVDTSNYFPYRPTFSSVALNHNRYFKKDFDKYWPSVHVPKTSGVDCSTYIQRIASYKDEPYLIDNIIWGPGNKKTGESSIDWNFKYDNSPIRSVDVLYKKSWLIDKYYHGVIVPGDILCMKGHVVIIDKIVYENNFRVISEINTKVIEAMTSGISEYKVVNFRSVNSFFSSPFFYGVDKHGKTRAPQIRRMQTK